METAELVLFPLIIQVLVTIIFYSSFCRIKTEMNVQLTVTDQKINEWIYCTFDYS